MSRYIKKEIRDKVLERDGWTGPGGILKKAIHGDTPQIHHIVRKVDGGKDTVKNLIAIGKNEHERTFGREKEFREEYKDLQKRRDRLKFWE